MTKQQQDDRNDDGIVVENKVVGEKTISFKVCCAQLTRGLSLIFMTRVTRELKNFCKQLQIKKTLKCHRRQRKETFPLNKKRHRHQNMRDNDNETK